VGATTEVKRSLRAVLDTNVVISALIFCRGSLAWLRDALSAGHVVPVVSAETLSELIRVLSYPRFRLDAEQQKIILTRYMQHAETLKSPRTRARLPVCRDAEDEMFLRLAYAAKVDALVTGDSDLLALAGLSKVVIIEPAELKRLVTAS
jgi:putative PIN family toxin of toxin-antitoxin system